MSSLVPPVVSGEDNLAVAMAYSQCHQWQVLPLGWINDESICGCWLGKECRRPRKHPLTTNGVNNATDDPETIRRWWAYWPLANVGICTGTKSGLLILDVDPRSGGTESLRKLLTDYGQLPDTLVCSTGGGGWHYYFQYPGEFQFRGKAPGFPGLDIKGDGGYVVAPPSRHFSGRVYRWLSNWRTTAIAPLPPWLQQLIMAEEKPSGKRRTGTGVSFSLPWKVVELSPEDWEIFYQLEDGRYGRDYQMLMDRDWEDRYDTQSEANLALLNKLARLTNGDAGRMYAIFQKTGLFRDGVEKHPSYYVRTIEKAIAGLNWRPERPVNRNRGGRSC